MADESARRPWRPGAPAAGVRLRGTLLATLVVGLALGAGALALTGLLRRELTRSARLAAESRAEALALLVAERPLPAQLPASVAGAGPPMLAQVLAVDGQPIATSVELAGAPPLAALRLAPGQRAGLELVWPGSDLDAGRDDPPGLPPDPEPAWLAGIGAQGSAGPVSILVVVSLEPAADAVDALLPLLAGILPGILAVTAAAVWLLIGRALAPVEAIRARAAAIAPGDLEAQVPVPAARDAVRQLALTVNAMLGRIAAAERQQRRFVSDASHELRSPVAALRMMLEVAEQHPERVARSELRRDLAHEVERLERLTDDLLFLARRDERGRTGSPRLAVDLAELVREELAASRARRELTLESRIAEPARLESDAKALRRLLRNLLDNALIHARGRVQVALARGPEGWTLRVEDDGPGIPPADRERVFERFVRLDAARSRAAGGSGLGLAVCQALAEDLGGSIRVVDTELGGACFELRLPAGGAPRAF